MPGTPETGAAMHALIARLYPICRSITGDGVRETLRILQEQVPLGTSVISSGMRAPRIARVSRTPSPVIERQIG